MRVLVIGGTQFNGFALVRELARTGHDVTILNRGKTDAPLPASIRRLTADRTDHARMKEVLGAEEFDVVQDMCAYRLEDVELDEDDIWELPCLLPGRYFAWLSLDDAESYGPVAFEVGVT